MAMAKVKNSQTIQLTPGITKKKKKKKKYNKLLEFVKLFLFIG